MKWDTWSLEYGSLDIGLFIGVLACEFSKEAAHYGDPIRMLGH